jgi:hypothetical protein
MSAKRGQGRQGSIPLMRMEHLSHFAGFFWDLGAPLDAGLRRVRMLPDGVPRFSRRDGRPIPQAPKPPVLAKDPIVLLEQRHREEGLEIDAETGFPSWDGGTWDLNWALHCLRSIGRPKKLSAGTSQPRTCQMSGLNRNPLNPGPLIVLLDGAIGKNLLLGPTSYSRASRIVSRICQGPGSELRCHSNQGHVADRGPESRSHRLF